MAREGLRTLVVAKRTLTEEQYQDFEVSCAVVAAQASSFLWELCRVTAMQPSFAVCVSEVWAHRLRSDWGPCSVHKGQQFRFLSRSRVCLRSASDLEAVWILEYLHRWQVKLSKAPKSKMLSRIWNYFLIWCHCSGCIWLLIISGFHIREKFNSS